VSDITQVGCKVYTTQVAVIYERLRQFLLLILKHKLYGGERRGAYRALEGKPEGRRPLGRPRRRWEDNIKMNLGEVGWRGADWIDLAQDRDRW
jgi:hypothetical protein